MAISQEHVKELERITADLGDLIQEMHPGLIKEWDIFDGAVTAHKHLRKLDTDSLRQLELLPVEKTPPEPKFRKDCPRCQGSGEWLDPLSPSRPAISCNCNEIENIAWESVKAEWKEELQPAEV